MALWVSTGSSTAWDSTRKTNANGRPGVWTALDEEAARDGGATKRAFTTATVRGTPRRKTKLVGGPKARQQRRNLVETV